MEYFKKKRKFSAVVRKFAGKMQKVKQSKETARKKVCVLTLDVKLTKAIKDAMPPRVQHFIGAGAGADPELHDDTAYNRLDLTFKLAIAAAIFPAGVFAKDAQPTIEMGRDDDHCDLTVKKVFFYEEDAWLQIELKCAHTAKLWQWAGDCLEADIVCEVTPLQKELDLDAGGAEPKEKVEQPKLPIGQEPEEDVRPAKLKNKKPKEEPAAVGGQ